VTPIPIPIFAPDERPLLEALDTGITVALLGAPVVEFVKRELDEDEDVVVLDALPPVDVPVTPASEVDVSLEEALPVVDAKMYPLRGTPNTNPSVAAILTDVGVVANSATPCALGVPPKYVNVCPIKSGDAHSPITPLVTLRMKS